MLVIHFFCTVNHWSIFKRNFIHIIPRLFIGSTGSLSAPNVLEGRPTFRSTRERSMRLLLPIALTLLVLAPASAYAVCLQAGQATTIIEGVLSEGTFTDANGQPEQAFILTPLLPTCLAAPSEKS